MFEIKIKAAFAADVSSTPVSGSVHLFSAAEKLAYSAAYSQFTDGDQVGIIGLIDDWVGRAVSSTVMPRWADLLMRSSLTKTARSMLHICHLRQNRPRFIRRLALEN